MRGTKIRSKHTGKVLYLLAVWLIAHGLGGCGDQNNTSNSKEDDTPPVISIQSPRNKAEVSGTVSVNLKASDNSELSEVKLFIDRKQLTRLSDPPFEWKWDTGIVHPGGYSLTAKAIDPTGNVDTDSIEVSVNSGCSKSEDCTTKSMESYNTEVRFLSPPADRSACGEVPLALTIQPRPPAMKAVEYRLGEALVAKASERPFRAKWDTTNVDNGKHTLKADLLGAVGVTASRTVSVDNSTDSCDNPPALRVVSPMNATRHAGKVDIRARAVDDTKLAGVQFAIDGTRMLNDTERPYRMIWDTSLFADGPYQLKIVATDSASQQTVETLGVTVDRSTLISEIMKPKREKLYQKRLDVHVGISTSLAVESVGLYVNRATHTGTRNFDEREPIKSLAEAPWKTVVDISSLESGKHILYAVANTRKGQTDHLGKLFNIDRPPSVEFDSPKDGKTYEEGVEVDIEAQDDLSVSSIEFRADGETIKTLEQGQTFKWHPGKKLQGPQTLEAVAKDSSGNTTTTEIEVVFECQQTWYPDRDEDGFGDPESPETIKTCKPTPPSHLIENSGDCDDEAAGTYPGAAHRDDLQACLKDSDGDGFGDSDPPSGIESGTDCDDTDPNKFQVWKVYRDKDGDDWGTGEKLTLCGGRGYPENTSDKNGDCNDEFPGAYPGAAPRDDQSKCMKDSDGDGYGDAKPPANVAPGTDCNDSNKRQFKEWKLFKDRDRDGFGAGSKRTVCSGHEFPEDWSLQNGDCGPMDGSVYPGAAQKDSQTECMKDSDGDGFGDADAPGEVVDGTDCNDNNQRLYNTYRAFKDADGDGWGVGSEQQVCGGREVPDGWAKLKGDCLDSSRTTFPGAAPEDHAEKCMKDDDLDEYGDANPPAGVEPGTDCLDSSAQTFPGAAPGDDPSRCLKDVDRDDYGAKDPPDGVTEGTDCDDRDRETYPGAAPGDSESECMTDKDGDRFGSVAPLPNVEAGSDCNDSNEAVKPAAFEMCDQIDNNCSGVVNEGCSCNYNGKRQGVCTNGHIGADEGECQPPSAYEANETKSDGLDNDCDGQVDESQ